MGRGEEWVPSTLSEIMRLSRVPLMVRTLAFTVYCCLDVDLDALEAEEESEDNGGNLAEALSAKKPLSFNPDDLDHFIQWPEYNYWNGFIKLNKSHNLEKFFFTTAYHGKEISIWTKRGELLNTWRAHVDKYK